MTFCCARQRELDRDLSFGPRAASMCSLSVARELKHLVRGQLQDLLDAAADGHEDLLALLGCPALAAGHVTVTTVGYALADGTGPDTDTVEGLADVDNNAHDLTILLVLQRVADGGQHDMQPQLIDVDVALLLELVGPLATVLVLGVFPLWPHAGLEEVVVGFEGEIRDGRDVVLWDGVSSGPCWLGVGQGRFG